MLEDWRVRKRSGEDGQPHWQAKRAKTEVASQQCCSCSCRTRPTAGFFGSTRASLGGEAGAKSPTRVPSRAYCPAAGASFGGSRDAVAAADAEAASGRADAAAGRAAAAAGRAAAAASGPAEDAATSGRAGARSGSGASAWAEGASGPEAAAAATRAPARARLACPGAGDSAGERPSPRGPEGSSAWCGITPLSAEASKVSSSAVHGFLSAQLARHAPPELRRQAARLAHSVGQTDLWWRW